MTESSLFWPTNGTGDGSAAGYSYEQMTQWLRSLLTPATGSDEGGVNPGYQNELAVSGTASPVAVATGAAHVYGFPYFNTAITNVAVPTPSASTRIDRIVLRVSWTAQTVRIVRVAGTEGGAAPALTQTPGTTYEISLAQASITTGGVITVTDERAFLQVAP